MFKETGKDIGSKIGNYIEIDKRAWQSDQAKFMRIRVELQVDRPLQRVGHIANLDGERLWVTFKYERLPTICFLCGRIGHNDRHCPTCSDGQKKEHQYGDWLRANGNYKGSAEKVKPKNESNSQPNDGKEKTSSQTPSEDTSGPVVEYSGGTQKSDGRYGVGKSEKWGALGEEAGLSGQAACQLPRWDRSEKVTPTTQSKKYAHDFQKALIFLLDRRKRQDMG